VDIKKIKASHAITGSQTMRRCRGFDVFAIRKV
jgi:hypothetical protein